MGEMVKIWGSLKKVPIFFFFEMFKYFMDINSP